MMKTIDNTKLTFAEQLEDAIHAQNIKKSDLATQLGVNRATISNWCKGNRTPRFQHARAICEILNLDVYEVLEIHRPNETLSDSEWDLLHRYRKLSQIQKNAVSSIVSSILDANNVPSNKNSL